MKKMHSIDHHCLIKRNLLDMPFREGPYADFDEKRRLVTRYRGDVYQVTDEAEIGAVVPEAKSCLR